MCNGSPIYTSPRANKIKYLFTCRSLKLVSAVLKNSVGWSDAPINSLPPSQAFTIYKKPTCTQTPPQVLSHVRNRPIHTLTPTLTHVQIYMHTLTLKHKCTCSANTNLSGNRLGMHQPLVCLADLWLSWTDCFRLAWLGCGICSTLSRGELVVDYIAGMWNMGGEGILSTVVGRGWMPVSVWCCVVFCF